MIQAEQLENLKNRVQHGLGLRWKIEKATKPDDIKDTITENI